MRQFEALVRGGVVAAVVGGILGWLSGGIVHAVGAATASWLIARPISRRLWRHAARAE